LAGAGVDVGRAKAHGRDVLQHPPGEPTVVSEQAEGDVPKTRSRPHRPVRPELQDIDGPPCSAARIPDHSVSPSFPAYPGNRPPARRDACYAGRYVSTIS